MGKMASGNRKKSRKLRVSIPVAELSARQRDALVVEKIFEGRDMASRQFSTDLVACMLIVDELSGQGYAFKSRVLPGGRAVVSFVCDENPCGRHNHPGPHGAQEIEGETLAVAICNAALLTRA